MKTSLLALAVAVTMTATPALADSIVGTWLRPSTGTLVNFAPCGSNFCGTVQNGQYSGQSIGTLSGSGSNYNGQITDLAEGKTYRGKARISGNTMKLQGCVAGGLICRGEDWQRQ
ncbi:MAG: DUF2147 domain-containing protein [Phyllobacteriaceae bacterium]|jgi:uncharacterized protein (DUF2147 family)|nr:DUF2147 domain-containing protein [Phyllobacteriaceae bacterium]